MSEQEDSECLYKDGCEDCGSSDACAVYDDGHTYCFSCGQYRNGSGHRNPKGSHAPKDPSLIQDGYYCAMSARGITETTCRKWGYQAGSYKGDPCHIANYLNSEGEVVAQKIRKKDKTFRFIGEPKKAGLFGQHIWQSGGRMVVVTEGEIDALSVSQLQGNKWPVVSIPNGAEGGARSIGKALDWLETFQSVVFMFDSDEPGRKAASQCAALLSPGKAYIARLGLKDPNELLMANRGAEVIDAIWKAKEYRPDGIISIDEVIERAQQPVEWGRSWPWETLTNYTYGRRFKELYALGAGVGSGKTDVFTQMIGHDILTYEEPVGVIYLEQSPVETAKRIAGKLKHKAFHVPDGDWTQEQLEDGLEQLRGRVHLYDHFGASDWLVIKNLIKHMAMGFGVKHVYLDHLTALTAHAEDERRELDGLMADLGSIVQSLDISLFFISHLATPEGKPHEEGGRVMARHFRGSRSIMQWANFMFGLERNQQAENEQDRHTCALRVLKDRNTGQSAGNTMGLKYDPSTGMLNEVSTEAMSIEESPFKDETNTQEQPF